MFILLVFDWDDEVRETKTIHAADLTDARAIGDRVMAVWPLAAGYQIWCEGQRLCDTCPQADEGQTKAPAAFLAYRRLANRRR